MDKMERIYALHKLLRARRTPVSAEGIMAKLGWSRSMVYRVIKELRDYLGAPIPDDRGRGFYYDPAAASYELPGLWFTPAEIHALLTLQTLMQNLGPGLLDAELEPLRERIEKLLAGRAAGKGELAKRIRILGMAARQTGEHFQTCASALVNRLRLGIVYLGRARNAATTRDISPQRLTRYRDAWYLDAWCHQKNALRSFAIERIQALKTLEQPATEIPDEDLNNHYASAYGIFAGPVTNIAVLRFTPQRARWVADEQWHPEQQSEYLKDGSYELRVPYGNPAELIMDILKHGPDVEVVEPVELREQVRARLADALKRY